jgi:hypothetical protein
MSASGLARERVREDHVRYLYAEVVPVIARRRVVIGRE